MAHVETRAVHIKVLNNEAVESKRILLEMQLLLLSTVRRIISIKEMREEEFKTKKEARLKMQDVSRAVREILSTLPLLEQADESKGIKGFDISMPAAKKKPFKEKSSRKARLDEELEAIKRRLEKLQ